MLAVVVVLPTPPLPDVMTTTRGVSPESSGLRFHWSMERMGIGVNLVRLEWRGFRDLVERWGRGWKEAGKE